MTKRIAGALLVGLTVAACAPQESPEAASEAGVPEGEVHTVRAEPVAARLEAAGIALPVAEATLSTKLMGTVTEVLVREGDRVRAGQPLVRIDARDLAARERQVAASLAEAEAVHREAETHAARMRALFAEQAAPKAQLDAAETGLVRAEAAVRAARAGAAELEAIGDYAVVRAPFDGVVAGRRVDPGSFAAPGAPLLTVQDARRLRATASVAPQAARSVAPGDTVPVVVEGTPGVAVVEGVVPVPGTGLYEVNVLVDNADGRFLASGAATLALPQGERRAITVPVGALVREGDLTGVRVVSGAGAELRWVRLGRTEGGRAEVLAGLRDGEKVLVSPPAGGGV